MFSYSLYFMNEKSCIKPQYFQLLIDQRITSTNYAVAITNIWGNH